MRTKCGIIFAAVMLAAGLGCERRGDAASFAEFDARARAGENLTVAYFGCSLMWSANASEPNETGFRGLMSRYLEKRYPKAHFRFVDATVGGTGAMLGVFRLERDVLSKKPDLVFLDFACNDGWDGKALATTCCYESIVRRLVDDGIPVMQMFFTFRFWAEKSLEPGSETAVHKRLVPYRCLADAYATGVGDVYRDSSLVADLRNGKTMLCDVWPIDGGHPVDLGYRYFAEAGIAGFERAIREGVVCRVPEKSVFGAVEDVQRLDVSFSNSDSKLQLENLVNPVNPVQETSWHKSLTYRTSLWYDGLSSRWMDDVLVFSGTNRAPLAVEAAGNMLGVFGEANENALTAAILCDGEKVADFNAYHKAGKGRLFFWRDVLLKDYGKGESMVHKWTIDPIPDGKGEFRIGAICTATIKPEATFAGDDGSDFDISAIDHARGVK